MVFKTPILYTSRLRIQPLKNSDTKKFFTLLKENKERIREDFPITIKNTETLEKTEIFVQEFIKSRKERSQIIYGIWIKQELIGCISIIKIDWSLPKCELAYYIDQKHERMGFISESVKCISKFCFTQLNMVKICIRTNKKNVKSQKVALASGFIQEAILRDEFRTGENKIVDLAYFGLTQRRFNRIKNIYED